MQCAHLDWILDWGKTVIKIYLEQLRKFRYGMNIRIDKAGH